MDNYIYFSFFIHMFSMSKLVMSWHLFSHAFLWHVIDRFLYNLTFCQIWSTVGLGSVQEGNLHFVILPKLRKCMWNGFVVLSPICVKLELDSLTSLRIVGFMSLSRHTEAKWNLTPLLWQKDQNISTQKSISVQCGILEM